MRTAGATDTADAATNAVTTVGTAATGPSVTGDNLSRWAPSHYKQFGAFNGPTVWTTCQYGRLAKVLNLTDWALCHYRQSVEMSNLSALPTCTNEETVSVTSCRFGHLVRIDNLPR